tara:strand:- start:3141 stop:3983 length:843 start_codon:yes stop_codon:yes gene_type:complete
MNKRGVEERPILWAAYLILVALIVSTTIFMTDKAAEASSFSDKYVSIDTSLILDTAQLAPGKLNLKYDYGDRILEIKGDKIKTNNMQFTYSPNLNQNLLIRGENNGLKIRNTDFIIPVNKKVVTSCFGNRNSQERNNNHRGVDLRADYEDVKVVADGTIKEYINGKGTENTLVIEHEEGIETRYLHLDKLEKNIKIDSKFKCIENCEVKKGQVVATSGQHGPRSHKQYAPHLHFEIRINGVPRDAIDYIFEPKDFQFIKNSNCFENRYRYAYGGEMTIVG